VDFAMQRNGGSGREKDLHDTDTPKALACFSCHKVPVTTDIYAWTGIQFKQRKQQLIGLMSLAILKVLMQFLSPFFDDCHEKLVKISTNA
jgi:hypothetical protein